MKWIGAFDGSLADITSVTAGTGLSGGGTTGAVTLNVSGLTISEFAGATIQTSAESFVDNDTSLMTSAAIQDKILAYGYSTTVGDITSVIGGTNCSVSGGTSGDATVNVDDAFLVNDGSDTTTGTITAAGFTTTGTITMPEYTDDAAIGITKIQDSGTTFADNDTSIMTAAAIADKVEAYGYSTTTGDIEGVTAGVGLSGGGTTGTPTLTVDFSEFSAVTPTSGDWFATLDSDGANEQLTTTDALATLFAGAGITASSGVIAVDAAQAITSVTADLAINGGDIILGTAGNTTATTVSTIINTGTTAGKDLTISAGSGLVSGSANVSGGDLILASGSGDGTGTSSLQFKTKINGTDAAAERMRIHTDGNVGIGTSSPGIRTLSTTGCSLLEIAGTPDAADDGATLVLRNLDTSIATSDVIGSIKAIGDDVNASEEGLGAEIKFQTAGTWNGTTYDYPTKIAFLTNDGSTGSSSAFAERMVINANGKVGIGTASPESLLHLESAGDAGLIIRADVGNTSGAGENDNPLIHLQQDFVASGSSGVLVDTKFGMVGDVGEIFTGSLKNATYITAQGSINTGSADTGTMQFATGGNNGQDTDIAGVDASARMTILPSGNVGVGTNAPGSLFQVNGEAKVTNLVCTAGIEITPLVQNARSIGSGGRILPDGNSLISATSSSVNHVIILPAPVLGRSLRIITINAFELRTNDPSNVAINGGTGSGAESAIAAEMIVDCVCTTTTTWVCTQTNSAGVQSAVQVSL